MIFFVHVNEPKKEYFEEFNYVRGLAISLLYGVI